MPDEPDPTGTDSSIDTDRDQPRWLLPALAVAFLRADAPERRMIRGWLDSWSGVGQVVEATHAHDYDVRLYQSVFGWSAEYYRSQISPLPPWSGEARAREPWRAVQLGALDTLRRAEAGER